MSNSTINLRLLTPCFVMYQGKTTITIPSPLFPIVTTLLCPKSYQYGAGIRELGRLATYTDPISLLILSQISLVVMNRADYNLYCHSGLAKT